jgi:hypothetical protein
MNDFVTRRWTARRERGEIIMNPMTHTKDKCSIASGGVGPAWRQTNPYYCGPTPRWSEQDCEGEGWFAYVMYLSYVTPAAGPLPVGSAISVGDEIDLQKEVSTRCLANRGNSQNNLFESIAQYRQTFSLLSNPLRSVQALLSKTSKAMKRGQSIAEAYLVFRYGVMPLIRDITGVISGLEKKVGNMRVSTRARGELMRDQSSSFTYAFGAGVMTVKIQNIDSLIVRAMSLDEYFVSKAQNVGFASSGLFIVPWELIPYSFVADWFVNLGDYFKALIPLPSLKNLGMCLTTHRIRQTIYTSAGTTNAGTWTVTRPPSGSCSASKEVKSRVPSLTPNIVVKSDFRFHDAVRASDAVALIVQRMGTIFSRR